MDIIEFLKVALFGIIEGITEWLPISSTGHMIILEEIMPLKNISPEFWDMFLVVIQLGAIMAVVVLYFNKLNPFSLKKTKEEKKSTWSLLFKIIVGCIPLGIVGVLFDDYIDAYLKTYIVVALALIVFGIIFIVVENKKKGQSFKINDLNQLSYKAAIGIGLIQVLSVIPGVSRSGVTIIGAMLLGTNRKIAAEYTFFLAIPVMLGASLLYVAKYIKDVGFNFTTNEILVLIVGIIVAFVVSVLVIRFLMNYIRKKDFKVFGYYRIALGLIVIAYYLFTKVL